jgi:hypothetical protein
MLRNVLEDYLSTIKEREFDYPLTALLRAMGFYDIHLTDGGSEIGKDFVAKRIDDGVKYQYVIQSKRGDINQPDFRNKIFGQLLEAVVLKRLSHPQLDIALPQRTILVSTGELKDNAILELRELNNTLENDYKKEKVEFWGKNRLIEFSEEYGLTGVHQTTAKGLTGFAQFYLTYSKAIDGTLSDREIEEFSRFWLNGTLEYRKRILRAAIESDIIATKLIEGGFLYEAITTYLSLARIVLQITYQNDDDFVIEIYKEIVQEKLLPLCRLLFTQFKSKWEEAEESLIHLCLDKSMFPMLHYLVWCARVLEVVSLYYFLTNDKAEKEAAVSFMLTFIEKEEGCGHIPGDRHSVSMVWPVLALIESGHTDEAINLVKRSVVWLCDRVEKGFGIARYEADEYTETITLVGFPFNFIKVDKNISSYLATILSDLAAFIGDRKFYEDVVNDFAACEIVYSYWQFSDTEGIFTIDTEDCTIYPNIPHRDSVGSFEDFDYAEHIKHESQSFQIAQKAGLNSLILLSILLKDRYFPKMWKQIISQNASADSSRKPKKSPVKQGVF